MPRPLVFTNGCFDILHAGHVYYLQRAKELGATLWVGVNSDPSIRKLKGAGRPVNLLQDRLAVLGALRCVDYLSAFDDLVPLALIEAVQPDILVKGADWAEKDIVGADFVNQRGGRVTTIELLAGHSTTKTIAAMRNHQD